MNSYTHKVILIICDGLGWREEKNHNAIAKANTPNFDNLWKNYPHALLKASGESIGLPDGQMGTSEANHLIIGSGRIIYQNLLKINHAVKNGTLSGNKILLNAFDYAHQNNSAIHIKGMISPGGVHGHMDHIKEILIAAKNYGVKDINLHLFTDGRDTPPQSAKKYLAVFEKNLKDIGIGEIATIGGRYWGMDRDNNHDRIEKHFKAIANAEAPVFPDALEVINAAYADGITDEFIEPAILKSYIDKGLKEKDAVISTNFRTDRAHQLTRRFLNEKIPGLHYVSMTKYADDIDTAILFPPETIVNTLTEIISAYKIPQLKITETEKFAHLTFYFNAQKYEANPLEERIMIPTNKDVATHDLKPEMKVFEITDEIVKAINLNKYGLICANLTNCDIVGHTGNFEATVKAMEAVDKALGIIVEAAKRKQTEVIITADHGNAEETFDFINGQPYTAHTLNPVPFILISGKYEKINHSEGFLADIAPTILKIMNLPVPKDMTGNSFV